MGFIRYFDKNKKDTLKGDDVNLYNSLIADIKDGKVFPAVRNREIHFYHRGGCLFWWSGDKLHRRDTYNKYLPTEAEEPDYYKRAKAQNENRYKNEDGSARERQLLDSLNNHTFGRNRTKVVVLDIEVCFRNKKGSLLKCDMVLLNTETNEIMFVEGKVFSDGRVNTEKERPEVLDQIKDYNEVIADQRNDIIAEYGKYIEIINHFFGTDYKSPIRLIDGVKLLVYERPTELNEKNGKRIFKAINDELKGDVHWCIGQEEPTINEIWGHLCK